MNPEEDIKTFIQKSEKNFEEVQQMGKELLKMKQRSKHKISAYIVLGSMVLLLFYMISFAFFTIPEKNAEYIQTILTVLMTSGVVAIINDLKQQHND